MKQLVLIGGSVFETPLLRQLLEEKFERIIAADSGLNWAHRLGLQPDLMMGDFDSVDPEVLRQYRQAGVPEKTFPTRKDYTDSELALWAAMDTAVEGDEICILGGIGSRIDHTLGNIFLLYEPLKKGIRARLTDGLNEIQMIQGPCELQLQRREQQQYISLLPFLGEAEGIDLEGMAYPLQDFTLKPGKCVGISNEFAEEIGVIRVKKGYLLVIRSTNDTPNR